MSIFLKHGKRAKANKRNTNSTPNDNQRFESLEQRMLLSGNAPTDIQIHGYRSLPDTVSVAENQPGRTIGELSAVDADAGDTHTFSVDNSNFVIEGNMLRLADGFSFDYETDSPVQINITATDSEGLSLTEALTVTPYDVPSEPIADLTTFQIVEGTVGTFLIDLTLKDTGSKTYTIERDFYNKYETEAATYNWQDISATGTAVLIAEDGATGPINLGFNFDFYDALFSTFRIGQNGWLAMGSDVDLPASPESSNMGFANGVDNMIAGFWKDMNTGVNGGIYYQQIDPDTMVVQYDQMSYQDHTGTATFQIILKSNGEAIFQYQQMDNLNEMYPAIGTQLNSNLGSNLIYSYNEQDFQAKAHRVFDPFGFVSGMPATVDLTYGQTTQISLTVDATSQTPSFHDTFFNLSHPDDDWPSSLGVSVRIVEDGPRIFKDTVSATTDEWTTVSLPFARWQSPVIVATPVHQDGQAPVVARIREIPNSDGPSGGEPIFEVMLQRTDGLTGTVTADVEYMIVEEGVYNLQDHGIDMEAVRFDSNLTAGKSDWSQVHSRSYSQTYLNPVVVGQVMSYNDTNFSTFFAHGASRTAIPSATSLNIGKHAGEDSNLSRATETIGYIVMEAGGYTIDTAHLLANGYAQTYIEAGVTSDTIVGVENGSRAYAPSVSPNGAVLSISGMDGGDGGWAVLDGGSDGSQAYRNDSLNLMIDEDQLGDTERKHTSEQVAFFSFRSFSTEDMVVGLSNGSSGTPWLVDKAPDSEDNAPTIVGSGVYDQDYQVSFNGSGHLLFNDSSQLNTGTHQERTIHVRFQPNSTTGRQVIYEEGGATRGLNIYIEDGVLYVGGWNQPTNQSGWTGTFLSTALTGDSWTTYTVSLVLKGDNTLSQDAMIAYLNGVEFGRGEGSQLWNHSDDIAMGNVAGSSRFHDGTTSGDYQFQGTIDRLLVFNRALLPHEIVLWNYVYYGFTLELTSGGSVE